MSLGIEGICVRKVEVVDYFACASNCCCLVLVGSYFRLYLVVLCLFRKVKSRLLSGDRSSATR
jgi:hypothetical protein